MPRRMNYEKANEPHHDQLVVWSDDIAEALLPWLKEFVDYDDKLRFFSVLHMELESITMAAHKAGMLRASAREG